MTVLFAILCVALGVGIGVKIIQVLKPPPAPRPSPERWTWTCHFCGRTRDDAKISVASRRRVLHAIELDEHRRYCNDDAECIDAAFDWAGRPERVYALDDEPE